MSAIPVISVGSRIDITDLISTTSDFSEAQVAFTLNEADPVTDDWHDAEVSNKTVSILVGPGAVELVKGIYTMYALIGPDVAGQERPLLRLGPAIIR